LERFICGRRSLKDASWVLQGIPLDMTVSRLHGTSLGPSTVRKESRGLESFSFNLMKDLESSPFADIGDLGMVPGDLERSLETVRYVSVGLFRRGFRVASLGGEHLVTLPIMKAASEIYPDIAVVHLDAHADLRDQYHGMRENHATVMRRVAEECLECPSLLYQFGIRSGTAEEYRWGVKNTSFYPLELAAPLLKVIPELQQRPVYLSLDIDIIDPGEAPGTGTPEPCGLSAREVLDALYLMKDLDVVGFDIVEVSPPNDVNGITSTLAAKLARECLIMWGGGNR